MKPAFQIQVRISSNYMVGAIWILTSLIWLYLALEPLTAQSPDSLRHLQFVNFAIWMAGGILFISTGPFTFNAYETYIRYGYNLYKTKINKDDIISIQAHDKLIGNYTWWSIKQLFLRRGYIYIFFKLYGQNKPVIIRANKYYYIIEVPDAEETTKKLRELYNIPDIPIEFPPKDD
jgi:hypothetical protein